MTKDEYISVVMMLKIGMKIAQYYSVFNYRPPISHNNVKSQDRSIVAVTGVDLETELFLPDKIKEKVGNEIPPYSLLMDNLETSLVTTVDKFSDNTFGSIVGRFIKPRASTMFCHPVYLLDGPGP